MTVRDWVDIILFILGVLVTIIGYLMSKRVESLAEDINNLYQVHHLDEKALNELNLKIAENYPIKQDLRIMTQDLKDYFDERFKVVEQIAKNNIKRRKDLTDE